MSPDAAPAAVAPGRRIPASPLSQAFRALFSFRVMLAAGLATAVIMTVCFRFNDPDLWFHLKMGQIVWNTHTIPSTDIFSFTAQGHAWTAHEWLAELSIYAAYRLGGYAALMVWFSTAASLVIVLTYALCYRFCGDALISFLGGLCAWFFATVGFSLRPHLLGYVFLAVELLLLESASRNRRWLWALPPLFALWVNCHGSYVFGLGVLFVYWVCSFLNFRVGLFVAEGSSRDLRKWLGVALALSLAALCINPVGIRLLLYPLNTAFSQSVGLDMVEEWRAPGLRELRTIAMLLVTLAIPAVALARRTELSLRDLAVAGAGFALATQHTRMLFVFGIVATPLLCRVVAPPAPRERKRDVPPANALFMAAFLAGVVWAFPNQANLREQIRKSSPVAAVDYIRKSGLSGPMLNEYVFGDYLIWALPEQKVFIDGRGDVFDWTGVFAEYRRWSTLAEDPNLLLNKWKIRYCLLQKDYPMARVIALLPGWRKAYSDDLASVFVRSPAN